MKKLLISTIILSLGTSLAWAQADSNSDKKVNPQLTSAEAATNSKTQRKVQLNPQPLPPGSKLALNPQPLPPGAKADARKSQVPKVALNPQPLPPGSKVSLKSQAKYKVNPQPLPPGSGKTATGTGAGPSK